MRTTATCPKCSGKKMMVVDVRQNPADPRNQLVPAIAALPVIAFNAKQWLASAPRMLGRFEAWICIACGFTELYAEDLGAIDVEELAAQYPDDVRIVDGAAGRRGRSANGCVPHGRAGATATDA
jgi:hypothetical protein